MTLKDIEIQLKSKPWARERRARHNFVMDMLEGKYFRGQVSRQILKDFIHEYNTIVRYIQIAQKDNVELRGEDYWQGKILSQEHALSLGYEVGYKQDVKQLKTC